MGNLDVLLDVSLGPPGRHRSTGVGAGEYRRTDEASVHYSGGAGSAQR